MFHIALIGMGYIAQNHIAAWNGIKDAQICAVICLEQDIGLAAAEAIGNHCTYYATIEDALANEEIHIVDICVPTFLHEFFAVKAASAGCHVLCEKPVTLTLESFDKMYSACQNNGVKFMVAQVERWSPEFMQIKKHLANGLLGKLHMVSINRLSQHPAWSNWHRDPRKSGGGLYDLMVHDLDYIYSIFGKPSKVYASGWKSSTGCWNHVVAQMSWSNGVNVLCESSLEMTGNFPFSMSLRATGDLGTINYSKTAGANINDAEHISILQWFAADTDHGVNIPIKAANPFKEEITEFLTAIKNNASLPIPPEESREVLQIVLAIRESLEENKIITIQ